MIPFSAGRLNQHGSIPRPHWATTFVLLASISSLGPTTLYARSYAPPPFIQDRSIGVSLADEMKALASNGASSRQINHEGRKILSQAYSAGGRYFQRNFPRGFNLDLSKNDISRVATNLLQGNVNNWHGYERELKYLNVIAGKDSPFELLKVNDRKWIKSGKLVEFDALLKDKRSGLLMSAEFKDKKIASRAELRQAKQQIDKISRRAREQRVSRSMWVNRKRVSENFRAELERYAAKRNVTVYIGVSTSERLPHESKNPKRFDDVLALESRGLGRWVRLAGRSVGVGATLYGLGKGGHTFYAWQRGGLNTRAAVAAGSEAAGAAAGGLGGAAAGAQIGLAVGSAFPPLAVISVPGGILVGGVLGAFGGGVGGKTAGEALAEEVLFKDLEHNETTAVIAYLREQY
jgi:hypothetical protein